MQNKIVLERVTLSLITHKHTQALLAVLNEEDVAQYNDYDLPQSREDIKHTIQNDLTAYYEGTGIRFAILHNQDNSFMGSVGFYDVSEEQAWLGFELSKSYWQQGFMHEVLTNLLINEHCLGFFKTKNIPIFARVKPENHKCTTLLKKIGFKQFDNYIYKYR